MEDLDRHSLERTFREIQERLFRLLNYATSVIASVQNNPEFLPEFAESVIVLGVSRIEAFFISDVSLGTKHRQRTVRRHLRKHGHEVALSCDVPTLVKLIRRGVSFQHGAKRLDNLFRLIFGCSVWPNDDVRETVLEFVRLRNFLVHSSGADWSQDGAHPPDYAEQFRKADVLTVRRYGQFATYHVDHYKALLFLREAILAAVEQLKYLEERIVRDVTWADTE